MEKFGILKIFPDLVRISLMVGECFGEQYSGDKYDSQKSPGLATSATNFISPGLWVAFVSSLFCMHFLFVKMLCAAHKNCMLNKLIFASHIYLQKVARKNTLVLTLLRMLVTIYCVDFRYSADIEIEKKVDLSELYADNSPLLVNGELHLQITLRPID